MLSRILKVEKSEKKRCKNRKKNLTRAPVIVLKRKNPSPFRSSLECSHKMEMKYSDKGTLVQRQRYPLPSRSLQYWLMNHCVRNTSSRRSVFENIFDNCFVIIGNGEFNHTWIKFRGGQNHRQQIVAGDFFSFHFSPYLHKACLIPWQNLFMKHFKFVSWQSGGSVPRTPRRGFAHGPYRSCLCRVAEFVGGQYTGQTLPPNFKFDRIDHKN